MDQTRSGNLGLHYLRAVAGFPQALAVTGEGLSVTHGQLAEASLALALGLHDRGMGQGCTVAVRTADPVISLASLLATALIGARWVFGHPGRDDAANLRVMAAQGVTTALLSPWNFRRLLAAVEAGAKPPASLRRILVGGGEVTPAFAARAEAQFGAEVVLCYGSNETG